MSTRSPFRRTREGIDVRLGLAEREVLRAIPDLLSSVGDPGGDPAAARLSPSPYPDDPSAAAEYARLMDEELSRARQDDRAAFQAGMDDHRASLEEEQAEAWLRVIGEARLVLASRLGIQEDGWEGRMPESDPGVALLHYLGWLQEQLIDVLAETLPEAS